MSFWFAVVMLLVFPIYMDKTRYYSITEAKWHAFMFLGIAYLGVCLVIAGVVFISKDERNARFKNGFQRLSLPQILIIIYFALACLSTVLSDYGLDCIIGQSRYEGLLSLFLYDGIFFGMSFWGEFSRYIFYAMGVAGIVVGAIGCLQVFKKDILFDEGYSYYNTGFASTLGNVDCISGVIATLVPVLLCAYVLLDDKFRFIFPIGAALMLFLQFVIDVDSGKLGLLAATLIAIPFLVDDKKKALRTAQMLGVACIVLGLGRMFTFPAVWPRAVDEIEEIQFAVTKPAGLMAILGAVVLIVAVLLEIRLVKRLQDAKKAKHLNSLG